ncbi:Uncharacterised protein [Serratia fonticola]|uniref:Uncharacterized protein n=1 Tax=Serratia fonticola TaxID=47917 RepID=A0A4U9UWF3_SERFO|nr:Uncharacterised protein [Serratia fonticola]
MAIDLMSLQVFQHVQAIFKGGFDGDITVFINQISQLLLGEKLIFHNDGFS